MGVETEHADDSYPDEDVDNVDEAFDDDERGTGKCGRITCSTGATLLVAEIDGERTGCAVAAATVEDG